MMSFILDTDILTLWQAGHARVVERCDQNADTIGIAVLSVQEQVSGWYTRLRKLRDRDQLIRTYQYMAATVSFLAKVPIATFTAEGMDVFDRLREQKLNVRKMDLCIAAIALELGAGVVTRNVRDFGRIPNLRSEDWSI